ncbi:conjugative transposon protein TraM [Aquimarina mytili]|uniref:Conjugative transposon protein TraM n=1 Tax=Aquimarina mytili TaxID=874423 RepID=A0A937DB46_9FLAO|nr:conjugative transposon protein TraM [Aquimarina mytili]MBL0683426.1 conjugative transposon protein TraM [Aquimarina mytili]
MDKKKKIIVGLVSILFAGMLVGFIKIVIFPSNKSKSQNRISIATPKVMEEKIDRKSKIQNYEEDKSLSRTKNEFIKNLSDVEDIAQKQTLEEEPIITGQKEPKDKTPKMLSKNKPRKSSQNKSTKKRTEEDDINDELQRIMAMQDQLIAESNMAGVSGDPNDIESLMQSYNQYANVYGQNPGINMQNLGQLGLSPEEIAETNQKASERLSNSIKEKMTKKNYFLGAGSTDGSDETLDLIPAETVDQGVLVNGSTIAIRTKKAVRLKNPALLIPKGAIIYGKVNISTDRLLIDINSYKKRDKLYILDFSLFDYDGREGVHLGNRTWPKIPSKVTKDVYDYAYQRGTQAAAFGGNSSIDLDQAKDVAVLSGAKEISQEIFEKRRVFMPKKYHLWFNINTK